VTKVKAKKNPGTKKANRISSMATKKRQKTARRRRRYEVQAFAYCGSTHAPRYSLELFCNLKAFIRKENLIRNTGGRQTYERLKV
jgi:hypothetical protein